VTAGAATGGDTRGNGRRASVAAPGGCHWSPLHRAAPVQPRRSRRGRAPVPRARRRGPTLARGWLPWAPAAARRRCGSVCLPTAGALLGRRNALSGVRRPSAAAARSGGPRGRVGEVEACCGRAGASPSIRRQGTAPAHDARRPVGAVPARGRTGPASWLPRAVRACPWHRVTAAVRFATGTGCMPQGGDAEDLDVAWGGLVAVAMALRTTRERRWRGGTTAWNGCKHADSACAILFRVDAKRRNRVHWSCVHAIFVSSSVSSFFSHCAGEKRSLGLVQTAKSSCSVCTPP